MSKYGVFSGPYFPVFRLNTGKHGPGKIPYLDTFHAMLMVMKYYKTFFFWMSKVWKFQNLKEKVLKSTFLSSYGFKTAKTKWLFQKVLQNYYDIVTKPEDIYCWYFVGTISKSAPFHYWKNSHICVRLSVPRKSLKWHYATMQQVRTLKVWCFNSHSKRLQITR